MFDERYPFTSPHFFLSTTLHRSNPSMPVHRPERLELHTANIADPQNSTSSINPLLLPPYPYPDLNKWQYRALASRKPPHNVQPLSPNIIALNDKQEHKHNLFYYPVRKKKIVQALRLQLQFKIPTDRPTTATSSPHMMIMMMMRMKMVMNMINKTLAKQILCGARS